MPDDRRTIPYLWAGVAAPIVFTTVYLVEGATTVGYDPLRHQVSLLSLGDRGWVQIPNILVTGALLVMFRDRLAQTDVGRSDLPLFLAEMAKISPPRLGSAQRFLNTRGSNPDGQRLGVG